jgi:hypothetical protein
MSYTKINATSLDTDSSELELIKPTKTPTLQGSANSRTDVPFANFLRSTLQLTPLPINSADVNHEKIFPARKLWIS